MKKQLLPIFCIFHICALFWWTVPHSFGNLLLTENRENSFSRSLIYWTMLAENSGIATFLNFYINATGSQQYWDFFAPHSVEFHQYLSVCEAVTVSSDKESISCKGQPLFTNLEQDFAVFQRFGSNRSRFYRLTENLIKLENQQLLQAFTQYYRMFPQRQGHSALMAKLVAHQFELHPELNDLSKVGYRSDTLLLAYP
jgi:hypothetical protein